MNLFLISFLCSCTNHQPMDVESAQGVQELDEKQEEVVHSERRQNKDETMVLYPVTVELQAYSDSSPIQIPARLRDKDNIVFRVIGHENGMDVLENLGKQVSRPSEFLYILKDYRLKFKAPAVQKKKVLQKLFVHTDGQGFQTIILPGIQLKQMNGFWHIDTGLAGVPYGAEVLARPVPAELVGDHFIHGHIWHHVKTDSRLFCKVDMGLMDDFATCLPEMPPPEKNHEESLKNTELEIDADEDEEVFV